MYRVLKICYGRVSPYKALNLTGAEQGSVKGYHWDGLYATGPRPNLTEGQQISLGKCAFDDVVRLIGSV